MIGSSRPTIDLNILQSKQMEAWVLKHYFNINTLPYRMSSPLREDKHPSFNLFIHNDKVLYKDFATGDSGNLLQLMAKIWGMDIYHAGDKILRECKDNKGSIILTNTKTYRYKTKSNCIMQVKVRDWKQHDIDYWKSYGISIEWLEYADVYPISHIFFTRKDKTSIISADKYAYVYVEHKENITTLKVYQPYSKKFKWMSKHNGSVISLWNKVPKQGKILCICSSVKDALCLTCNTSIPAIAPQGEGYKMSKTAIENLKKRFSTIYILFDNDAPGIEDAKKLSEETGFTNIVLPQFEGGKDVSDLYKTLQNTEKFKEIILSLFN